jgi:hypothetical protein
MLDAILAYGVSQWWRSESELFGGVGHGEQLSFLD